MQKQRGKTDKAQAVAGNTRVDGVSDESGQSNPADTANMKLLDGALRKAIVDDWGGKLYFVYLPERYTSLRYTRPAAIRTQVSLS